MDKDELLECAIDAISDWSNDFNEGIGGYLGASWKGDVLTITADIRDDENDCGFGVGEHVAKFRLVPVEE